MSIADLRGYQRTLENLFAKNQLIPRIKKFYQEEVQFDFDSFFEANGIPNDFGYDVLIQMSLYKRANIQTLVGILYKHTKDSQEVANLLNTLVELGMIEYDDNTSMFIVVIDITQSVQDDLDRYQFPLPMIVPPEKVTTNKSYGYITLEGSIILRNNHHNRDVNLNHINRMNKVKLCLNMDTMIMIQNAWRNLDKKKDDETIEDFDKRVKAFNKYDRDAKFVAHLITSVSRFFFLNHKYDKRGRTNALGYHITTQGADWNKACIEFYDKELID